MPVFLKAGLAREVAGVMDHLQLPEDPTTGQHVHLTLSLQRDRSRPHYLLQADDHSTLLGELFHCPSCHLGQLVQLPAHHLSPRRLTVD